jgi:DNA-directed RNA polymerase subunit E'/Rpb7
MSSTKMFMPIKFNTTIQLQPKEVNSKFEETILRKLKQNLENVCSRHGYIKKDSIKIIKRSAGYFKEQHFNGNLAFDLNCIAEICNPAQDSIIVCHVKGKNALGIRAEGTYDNFTILEIVVPKISYGIQSDVNIDNIQIGDEIKVQVCGKKFMLYDDKISIIGKIIKDKEENIVIQENDDDETDMIDIQQQDDLEQDDNIIIDSVLHDEESEYDDDESEIVKKINVNDDEIDRQSDDVGVDGEDEDEDEEDIEEDDEFNEIDDEEFDMEEIMNDTYVEDD